MKNFLKVLYLVIFLIIGYVSLKNYSERYDIDIKHPMIKRIKSIPYDEYTDEYQLESMLDEERENAESVWNTFLTGESDDTLDIMEIKSFDDINFEKTYKPLRKEWLNTIQKLILIENYLIKYPVGGLVYEGLSQFEEHLDYSDLIDISGYIHNKIKKSILSDIKKPNILEISVRGQVHIRTEFDDTLDVENYERVNKLFDSLFRIYELKNNYHKRYGKKNYDDLTTPKNSLFNLINNNE